MIIKNLPQIGNPKLREKSRLLKKAEISSPYVRKTIKDLKDSLEYYKLYGMAAPQISKNIRLFVVGSKEEGYFIYINPRITWTSKKEIEFFEGCGSVLIGDLRAPVLRPESVVIEATDEKGKKFKEKASGILARVIQHEYDHLDGVLFTDKISDFKRMMTAKEFNKFRNNKIPKLNKTNKK